MLSFAAELTECDEASASKGDGEEEKAEVHLQRRS